jgi:protein O-GlcNAc transferase
MDTKQTSTSLQPLFDQAFLLHQKGKFAKAERLYQHILSVEPGNLYANYYLGVVRFQQGRYDEALDFLNAALKSNPEAPEVLTTHGLVLYTVGRLEEALATLDKSLAIQPRAVEALTNRGNVLQRLQRCEEAIASYDKALALSPYFAAAAYNRGLALQDMNRFDEALASYDRALKIKPDHAEAWSNRGSVLRSLKHFDGALKSFARVLAIQPGNASAWYNLGTAQRDLGRIDDALASFEKALALKPDFAEALNNRGAVLQNMERFSEALLSYDRSLAIKPDYPEALSNRAEALKGLKRFDEALDSCNLALAISPTFAGAWNNRGIALHNLNRLDEALASFENALVIDPDYAEPLYNCGISLRELRRFAEALITYDNALARKPNYAEAWNNRGIVLHDLKRLDDAVASYDRALAIRPDYAEALNNRGTALRGLKRFSEALAAYDEALVVRPDYAEALSNRGMLQWTEYRRYDSAIRDLERAVHLDPEQDYALGNLLHLRMHGADWCDFQQQVTLVNEGVRAGKRVADPFMYQAISESPEDLQACAITYANHRYPQVAALATTVRPDDGKIRVGYVSGEFREQATAFLTAGLYEAHDKSRFHIVAFDNGPNDNGLMRKRLEGAFNKWVDISAFSDKAAAQSVADEGIDILVNLNGYFGLARMELFAHRPAPIQVNYLGFPGTLGASYVDYIIADPFVIPQNERQHYTESVVYLPDSYQANDSRRPIAKMIPNRAQCGLPETAFVFCNFNQSYKLTPTMFAMWMRILQQVEGSVLWLLQSNMACAKNLRHAAERHGIARERLVFAPALPVDRHLARLKQADLFLDSLPYNAHTTASDALWAGVPLVTSLGKTFPGRVAASLLHAVGLPEMIADSLPGYERLALKLANDPTLLRSIREKLAQNRLNVALFDTDRFRLNIEAAYTTMWEIMARGETARSFTVELSP